MSRTLRSGAATIAYERVGHGPAVILGHSLFCSRAMWAPVLERLGDRLCVVNVELRGHGESTAPAPFTLWDLVEDWRRILDRENIEQAVVGGLSTGGMTALRFALRYPDRVRGLALFDTSAAAERGLDRVKYGLLGAAYTRLGIVPRRQLLQAMFAPATLERRPELGRALLDELRSFDRRQLGRTMRAVFGREPLDVRSIRKPAMVVVGDADRATPPSRARSIAAAIEGCELHVLRGAGHLTALEQPDEVARLLLDFARRVAD